VARATLLLMLVALAASSYRLWVSDDGMREVWRLGAAQQAQSEENVALKARNDALEAEVRDLKEGLDAVEERARQELGMTREGETFFQVVEPERAVAGRDD
jgi:cell division protein FtsB